MKTKKKFPMPSYSRKKSNGSISAASKSSSSDPLDSSERSKGSKVSRSASIRSLGSRFSLPGSKKNKPRCIGVVDCNRSNVSGYTESRSGDSIKSDCVGSVRGCEDDVTSFSLKKMETGSSNNNVDGRPPLPPPMPTVATSVHRHQPSPANKRARASPPSPDSRYDLKETPRVRVDGISKVDSRNVKEETLLDRLSLNRMVLSDSDVCDEENHNHNKREEKKDESTTSTTSQISRIWNEYIGEGGTNKLVCALPDDICSFWNICGQGLNGVHDDDDEDAVIQSKTDSFQQMNHRPVKKKPKINMPSLPQAPEPIVIPQVFIKKKSRGEFDYDEHINMVEYTTIMTVEKQASHIIETRQAQSFDKPFHKQASHIIETRSLSTIATESPKEDDVNTTGAVDSLVPHMNQDDVNVVSPNSSCESTVVTEAPQVTSDTTSVKLLKSVYQEHYSSLRNQHQVHVRFLDTYQGRIPASTNGCTVIAPLMCINYFTSTPEQNRSSCFPMWDDELTNNGIPDQLVNEVIDDHAASILPIIRSKLKLHQDSFIVPSDVHDYLIEVGLLSSSQFVGVCGGNILNEQHLATFKSTLLLLDDDRERERLKGRKIGATLFFSEHVIALHRIENGTDVFIELIDSLPNPETWMLGTHEYEDLPENAVRVRCKAEHFDTLLLQYALNKFSREERRFIDSTVWKNSYCESDPRVFQAFTWSEAA